MSERKSIQIDGDLHRTLKGEAVVKGVPVQELVDKILKEWIEKNSSWPEGKPGV